MKTADLIKEEISEIINRPYSPLEREGREYKQNKKKVKFLKDCLMYLESNPKEEFIKKMIRDINEKKEIINQQYQKWLPYWKPKNENPKPLPAFNRESGITKMNKQLSVLRALLRN